jgi:hypothetical protein
LCSNDFLHPAACRGSQLSTTFATFGFDFTLPESRHSPSSANDTFRTVSIVESGRSYVEIFFIGCGFVCAEF